MATVTLTIEGEPEEIRSALTVLLDQEVVNLPVDTLQTESGPVEDAPSETPWSDDDVAMWWENLTPGAQKILAEIATRPEGYPASELAESVGLDMRGIGSRIGSSTHNMKRLFKKNGKFTKPQPWTFNGPLRRYVVHPDVAAVVLRLSEPDTARPGE
ncbi:MAG: hypothetical protein M3462_12030 [Chloroflexota bacterium]|nr:hypothetical protein [Chloroflexota bacterium]